MRLLRTFPILANALVLLAIVGVSVATRSIGLLLVGGVLAALSWYVTEGPRGRSLPNWTANILIIAASLNVVVELIGATNDILSVLGRFVVFLTLIKLYQHKSPRDYAQLLGLSLLLMLVGCIQSNTLLFAVTVLLYAVMGLYVLLVFQLYAAHERNRAARLAATPSAYRQTPSLQPIVGRRTGVHLRTLMVFIAAGGFGASILLFVLFPRDIGQGVVRLSTVDRLTGYTDEVNLTSGTRITSSRRVVMNLRVQGSAPNELLRLRGAVLDRYDGRGRWSRSAMHHQQMITTEPPGLTSLGAQIEGPTILQEFDLLAPSRTVFSVSVPTGIGAPHPYRFRFDRSSLTLLHTEAGAIHRYTVSAQRDPTESTLRLLVGRANPDGASIVRQFETFDPRVRRLALDLLAAVGLNDRPPADGEARWAFNAAGARALTGYLQGGRYRYETDLRSVRLGGPDSAAADPIVQFLFESRIGHCEYFASALAVLCNTAGIPARLVTGYIALERDDRTGQYIIRESNAHAWVEVSTSPYRWETFDPTPAGTLHNLHGTRYTRTDRWRWLFDQMEAKWSNAFIAFDHRAQRRMISALDLGWGQRLDHTVYATRRWMARVNRAFYLGPAGYIWMGIVATAVVIAAIAVWKRVRRTARLRSTLQLDHVGGWSHHDMLHQLGFYLDMLTALETAGLAKPRWQPPLAYARALAGAHPREASLTRQLTKLYYAARYGRARLSREQVAHAESLVAALRTAADDRGGYRRRFTGPSRSHRPPDASAGGSEGSH